MIAITDVFYEQGMLHKVGRQLKTRIGTHLKKNKGKYLAGAGLAAVVGRGLTKGASKAKRVSDEQIGNMLGKLVRYSGE